MVQIIPQRQRLGPSKNERADQFINMGAQLMGDYAQKQQAQQQYQQENEAIKSLTGMDPSGIRDPKMRQRLLDLSLQGQQESQMQQFKMQQQLSQQQQQQNQQAIVGKVLRGDQVTPEERATLPSNVQIALDKATAPKNAPGGLTGQPTPPDVASAIENILDKSENMNADQLQVALDKAGVPRAFSNSAVETRRRQDETKAKNVLEQEKTERQTFESERQFHTGYSKKAVEEAEALRASLPKLQMSLDFARNAVESGEVGAFSLANLGERLNMPELQTAKGAQLVTAAKENLLGNMSRVSSRAQNKWFEQRLNSMMAKVGQSQEANLSAQEMLEAEAAMGQSYLNEFDRITEEDMQKYGYERKDIAKRARNASKTYEDHIFNRASYRLKEIEEQEKGLSELKKQVGKNVMQGTPITLAMAKLYKEKFGDNALEVAKKNGYYIPTVDEFKAYQQRPREFREGLVNE